MADNVTVTPGSGDTIATDDIGGIQYQRIKIGFGVDGAYVDVSSSAPMPMWVTSTVPQPVFTDIASPLAVVVRSTVPQPAFWETTSRMAVDTDRPPTVGSFQIGSVGQVFSLGVSNFSAMRIHIASGTVGSLNAVFEGTIDGSVWFGLISQRTNQPTAVETGILPNIVLTGSGANWAYAFNVDRLTGFRIRPFSGPAAGVANIHFATDNGRFVPAPISNPSVTGSVFVVGTVTLGAAPTVTAASASVVQAIARADVSAGVASHFHGTFTNSTHETSVRGAARVTILALNITNSVSSDMVFQLYNAPGTPIVTSAHLPILSVFVPARHHQSVNLPPGGISCLSGAAFRLNTSTGTPAATAPASGVAVSISYI